MIKKRPVNHNDWVKDNARWRTHLADTLVENAQSSSFDKVKGYFVDSFGDRVKPEKVLEEQKQLSKLVKDLTPRDHEWNPNTKQYEPKKLKGYYYNKLTDELEPRNNPSPHISSIEPKQLNLPGMENLPIQKEPKIHTPAYRRKYPERYKTGYVKWYDRDRKEKIVTDLPATAKMNRNVVPKESKPAEIKNSTLLSNLEALHQMSFSSLTSLLFFQIPFIPVPSAAVRVPCP